MFCSKNCIRIARRNRTSIYEETLQVSCVELHNCVKFFFLTAGWCYVRHIPASFVNTTGGCDPDKSYDSMQSVLASLLGYDLWVYIAFVVLPVLYVTMHCYLRCKVTGMAVLVHGLYVGVASFLRGEGPGDEAIRTCRCKVGIPIYRPPRLAGHKTG